MRRITAIFGMFAVLATVPAVAASDSAEAKHLHVQLVFPQTQLSVSAPNKAGLYFKLEPGWHVYWVNAGDSGEPPHVKWTLPAGVTAGPLQFPAPTRLPLGPLMDFGYEGKLWLLTSLRAPANAQPGTVLLKAKVSWLVCKEICIPEETQLTLPLGIGAAPSPSYPDIAAQFGAARAKSPQTVRWPSTFAWGP